MKHEKHYTQEEIKKISVDGIEYIIEPKSLEIKYNPETSSMVLKYIAVENKEKKMKKALIKKAMNKIKNLLWAIFHPKKWIKCKRSNINIKLRTMPG